MKKRIVCLLLASAAIVHAQVFTAPSLSNNRVNLSGTSPGEGVAAFSHALIDQPDSGHNVISQNAPDSRAYYYLTGREHSPAGGYPNLNHTAKGTGLTGMNTTTAYMSGFGGDLSLMTVQYGHTTASRLDTWNLGADAQNSDWFASADSTLEERKY